MSLLLVHGASHSSQLLVLLASLKLHLRWRAFEVDQRLVLEDAGLVGDAIEEVLVVRGDDDGPLYGRVGHRREVVLEPDRGRKVEEVRRFIELRQERSAHQDKSSWNQGSRGQTRSSSEPTRSPPARAHRDRQPPDKDAKGPSIMA